MKCATGPQTEVNPRPNTFHVSTQPLDYFLPITVRPKTRKTKTMEVLCIAICRVFDTRTKTTNKQTNKIKQEQTYLL